MRPARFLTIATAAAIAAVFVAEGWWLAEGYNDARTCINALPALEETGDLVVDGLARSNNLPGVFEIAYSAKGALSDWPGSMRCAFGDGPDGRRHLLGIEFNDQPIGEARLYFLERFWLNDPAAVQSGKARLKNEIPPLAFLTAIVGRPNPALIGAIAFAILAAASLAASRFAGRRRRE